MLHDDHEEVHATLVFDGEDVDQQKVRAAEQLLREAGVSFDTGAAVGGDGATVEWELDWSLDGATLYESPSPMGD